MLDSALLLVQAIAVILTTAICTYAAYWAFIIRRALAVRLYRNQALGIGLVGLSIAVTEVGVTAISYAIGRPDPGPLSEPFAFFAFIMTFFWIDASVLAARRSDPLLRDTFHWTRLRFALWALNVFAIAIDLSALAYIVAYSPGGVVTTTPPGPFFFALLAPFFITAVTGIVILPTVALRSRDMTFRRHLKWFGVFSAFLVFFLLGIVIALNGSQTPVAQLGAQLIIDAGFACGGYCLYRSARSLVPLNRLSPIEKGA